MNWSKFQTDFLRILLPVKLSQAIDCLNLTHKSTPIQFIQTYLLNFNPRILITDVLMPTFKLLCRIPFGSVDFCWLFRSFSPLWNGSMHVTRQAHELAQPQNPPGHDIMVRDSRGLAQQLACLQMKPQYACIRIH